MMFTVGIVSALKSEAACLTKNKTSLQTPLPLGDNGWFCLSGIGGEAASIAAHKLCDTQSVQINALMSFGVAAALDNTLKPGDLILPETVHNGTVLPVAQAWRERVAQKLAGCGFNLNGGMLSHSAVALTSAQHKTALSTQTGACAADMETAAIADCAVQRQLPFIAIRAVVDPLEFSPPPALIDAVHADGTADIKRLLPLICSGKVSLMTLIRLGKGMHAACKTLKRVATCIGADFGFDRSLSADSEHFAHSGSAQSTGHRR